LLLVILETAKPRVVVETSVLFSLHKIRQKKRRILKQTNSLDAKVI
jgi:hypothetical protein